MQHPTKPIGPFYSHAEAEDRGSGNSDGRSWKMPRVDIAAWCPRRSRSEIVELEVIRDLVERNVLVMACGGGGIPVMWKDGKLSGVEAVIDKDRASALLASQLGVDIFVISTDTDYVYLDYKKPSQRPLREVRADRVAEVSAPGNFRRETWGPRWSRCCDS